MADALILAVYIQAHDNFTNVMKKIGIDSSTTFGGIQVAALAVGAAMAALAYHAVKMAGDFKSGIVSLQTEAGELPNNLKMVSDGILQISRDTGTSTNDLITSMRLIESANNHGQQGLDLLTAAAQGAKVGFADLYSLTQVVTVSMHNYGLASSQSVPVINSLVEAVKDGTMRMDDLNQALINVLPAASKAGVSLTDVEGAISAMALSGDKGAAAGTHLSQMFLSLQKPTSAAKSILKDIGLTTQEISDKMKKSLPDTLLMIYNALAEKFPVGSAAFNAAAATIVGGMKQMKSWNELTGKSFADLVTDTKKIGDAYKNSGKSVTDWNEIQKTFNFQMDRIKKTLDTLFITLGTNLLPPLTRFMDLLGTQLSGVGKWLSEPANMDTLKNSLIGISGVIATVLTPALIEAAIPMLPFAAAIAGIIIVGTFLGQHLDVLKAILKNIKDAFTNAWTAVKPLVDLIGKNLQPVIKQIQDSLKNAKPSLDQLGVAFGQLLTAMKPLLPLLKPLAEFFGLMIIGAIGLLIGILSGLAGALTGIVHVIKGVVEIITGWIDMIVGVFTGNNKLILKGQKELMQGIDDLWKGMWNTVTGFVSGFVNAILTFFKGMADSLVGHSIIPDMINAIVAWFKGLPSKVMNGIGGLASTIATFFGNIATNMFNAGQSIIQNLINGISGMAGALAGAIGSTVGNALKNIPGAGGILHGLGIPGFASGGIMPYSGLAMVGERGPELMAVPGGSRIYNSSDTSRMLNSGTGIGGRGGHTYNLSFPNAINKDQIKQAVQEIQQDDYRAARRPGGYQGFRAGVQ